LLRLFFIAGVSGAMCWLWGSKFVWLLVCLFCFFDWMVGLLVCFVKQQSIHNKETQQTNKETNNKQRNKHYHNTNKQTNHTMQRDIQTYKQRNKVQTNKQTNTQAHKEKCNQTNKQTNKPLNTQT
jgi:cytoskeletal protein RodZ